MLNPEDLPAFIEQTKERSAVASVTIDGTRYNVFRRDIPELLAMGVIDQETADKWNGRVGR